MQNDIALDTVPNESFDLHKRRYIGSKAKLSSWILNLIQKKCKTKDTFIDLFSGTAVVAREAMKSYENVILNDVLYSNYTIYKAFFGLGEYDFKKLSDMAKFYNSVDIDNLEDNYFSIHFADKYFSLKTAKLIGFIREDLEKQKASLSAKEYDILLASLIYSCDRVANTVGHFDAYIKSSIYPRIFSFNLIKPTKSANVKIYREDANTLAKKIKGDIAYIDPPYNSRQYSRLYHLYENLTEWKKPKLYGVALKPKLQNQSPYCTVKAKDSFKELVESLDVRYLVISYSNTYKSPSSANKIDYKELLDILQRVGKTEVHRRSHKCFNTTKNSFKKHKELLFLTKKN